MVKRIRHKTIKNKKKKPYIFAHKLYTKLVLINKSLFFKLFQCNIFFSRYPAIFVQFPRFLLYRRASPNCETSGFYTTIYDDTQQAVSEAIAVGFMATVMARLR